MPQKDKYTTIQEFYLAASQFCKLLEEVSAFPKRVFLSNVQKILSLIYLKASLMMKPDESDSGEPEKFVQENDWIFIKDQISTKLALSDKFIEIPLPEGTDPENFETITLSESLADIYQDLKDFSTNFEIGNDEATLISLYVCLDNFEKFWGIRALVCLTAIHHFLYNEETFEDETDDAQDKQTNPFSIDTSNWLINKRFDN